MFDHVVHRVWKGLTCKSIARYRQTVWAIIISKDKMKKLWLQIEFTPDVQRELRQLWDAHQRQERFAMVGIGAGSILGLLSLVFALLKFDTWTKGYYSKRLFIGVPVAIIGGWFLLLVFGKFFARYIT